jgi:anti-sigma factor RsiW
MGHTWAEHLAWCKARAREYIDMGDLDGACRSMMSDLNKHPDSPKARPPAERLQDNEASVRRWIEGFG